MSVQHCRVLSPSPPGNSVLCHSPVCWISLGPTVNAIFLHFSFILNTGLLGQYLFEILAILG